MTDVIMPPVGMLLSGVDFRDLAITLKDKAGETEAVTIRYGNFIQTVLDFLIVAVAIFLMIKVMNAAKRKEEAAPPPPAAPSKEEVLLTEIRDALRAKK